MVDPDPGYRPKRAFVEPSSSDEHQEGRPGETASEHAEAPADQVDQGARPQHDGRG